MQVFARKFSQLNKHMVALVVALLCLVAVGTNVCLADTSVAPKVRLGKKDKMTNDPIVVMDTSKGTIKIQIYKNEAPITSNNFLDLVQRGFYNGLGFHRYEPGFVIQGGDPKGNGTGGFIDPQSHSERRIPLEVKANLKHDTGVIAMARSSDPNSASSQFYFTLAPASFLDMQYAVFGKVIDGMPVVQQLRAGDKMTKVSMLETANK